MTKQCKEGKDKKEYDNGATRDFFTSRLKTFERPRYDLTRGSYYTKDSSLGMTTRFLFYPTVKRGVMSRPALQERDCKREKINSGEIRKSITMKSGGKGEAREGE
jgi:hypothetical protein